MWVSENKIGKERGCCCTPIIITKFGGEGEAGRFLWGNFQTYKICLYVLFYFPLWNNENGRNIFIHPFFHG